MNKPLSLPAIILVAILALVGAVYLRAVVTTDHPLRAACMSNVKQLSVGMLMYADKNDDRFPLSDSWMDSASGSMNNSANRSFYCPFIKDRKPDQYGYSMYYMMASRKHSSLAKPDQTVLVFESVVLDKNAATGLQGFGDRHEMVPFGFADGHAKGYGQANLADRDKVVAFNAAIK